MTCHGPAYVDPDPVCGLTGQPIHTSKCTYGTGPLVQAAHNAEVPHHQGFPNDILIFCVETDK